MLSPCPDQELAPNFLKLELEACAVEAGGSYNWRCTKLLCDHGAPVASQCGPGVEIFVDKLYRTGVA